MKNFTEWKSVNAYGRYNELTDETGRCDAMHLLADGMMHVKPGASAQQLQPSVVRPHSGSGNAKTYVSRIVITELTGRFESQDAAANNEESF